MKSIYWGIVVMVMGLGFYLQGCTYDKEIAAPLSNCSDTLNVSFLTRVQPLLMANCYACHGNGASQGNVSLENFEKVKQVALSGRLLGAISHTAGFAPMPVGAAKLSACDITAVNTWIQEGTQNN